MAFNRNLTGIKHDLVLKVHQKLSNKIDKSLSVEYLNLTKYDSLNIALCTLWWHRFIRKSEAVLKYHTHPFLNVSG